MRGIVVLWPLNGCSLAACRCLTYVMIPKFITDEHAAWIRWASQNLIRKKKKKNNNSKISLLLKAHPNKIDHRSYSSIRLFWLLAMCALFGSRSLVLSKRKLRSTKKCSKLRCKQHLTYRRIANRIQKVRVFL